MNSSKLKEVISKLVEETLEEMSTTGAVAGFSTPFAFSRKGKKNNATKTSEKMGFIPTMVGEDENVEVELESLLEDVDYDASKDVVGLKKSVTAAESTLEKKYVDSLRQKFLGKNVEITGSKGYGQVKNKYTIRVMDISIEDWYKKDDYQLILTGEDQKKYFVDILSPIKILTSQPASASPAKSAPVVTPTPAQTTKTPTKAPVVAPVATPLEKQISK